MIKYISSVAYTQSYNSFIIVYTLLTNYNLPKFNKHKLNFTYHLSLKTLEFYELSNAF